MAIAIIGEVPGGNAQQDEELSRAMGVLESPPTGALLRIAGATEAGFRVISVWESREAFDEFRRSTLEPALRQLGIPVPEFQIWPLESIRIAPGAQQMIASRR